MGHTIDINISSGRLQHIVPFREGSGFCEADLMSSYIKKVISKYIRTIFKSLFKDSEDRMKFNRPTIRMIGSP
jgi:hypothetical protein